MQTEFTEASHEIGCARALIPMLGYPYINFNNRTFTTVENKIQEVPSDAYLISASNRIDSYDGKRESETA